MVAVVVVVVVVVLVVVVVEVLVAFKAQEVFLPFLHYCSAMSRLAARFCCSRVDQGPRSCN